MDIAQYEGTVVNINTELSKSSESDRARTIEKYRRIAEKGAMSCPFCNEKLQLRAGEVREIHFAHLKGKSCQEADAYDTYRNQTQRENKKHSVIKEIIYTELKSQEIIKPDLKVEYGYKEKAAEKWKHYPDIYMNKNGREFAISVITNVHNIGDEKVVKTINKRNRYFEEKGLKSIWFVEDRELADDYEHRVLHLWEAEYDLAIKTEEDQIWDQLINDIVDEFPNEKLLDLFHYKAYGPMDVDVRSLYYVHSTGDEISFSVYRLILDEKQSPYRAFAVTRGYRMHMSNALIVRDEILLSDKQREDADRIDFVNEVARKLEQAREVEQAAAKVPELSYKEVAVTALPKAIEVADIDVLEYMEKLNHLRISESEAKTLFKYMKKHRSDLGDYGLSFADVMRTINYALGKIMDPKIRIWLVDIEYLR